MSEEVAKPTKTKAEEPKFTVDNLVDSKKFRYQKDVLRVVLEKGKEYSLVEAQNKIDAFMKGGKQ